MTAVIYRSAQLHTPHVSGTQRLDLASGSWDLGMSHFKKPPCNGCIDITLRLHLYDIYIYIHIYDYICVKFLTTYMDLTFLLWLDCF